MRGELEEEEGEAPVNPLVVIGPVSSGKTASVLTCAARAGFIVKEISVPMMKGGADLLRQCAETVQSHALDLDGLEPLRLLLLDEADVLLEEGGDGRRLCGAMLEVIRSAKIPVVLTSEMPLAWLESAQGPRFETVYFHRPSLSTGADESLVTFLGGGDERGARLSRALAGGEEGGEKSADPFLGWLDEQLIDFAMFDSVLTRLPSAPRPFVPPQLEVEVMEVEKVSRAAAREDLRVLSATAAFLEDLSFSDLLSGAEGVVEGASDECAAGLCGAVLSLTRLLLTSRVSLLSHSLARSPAVETIDDDNHDNDDDDLNDTEEEEVEDEEEEEEDEEDGEGEEQWSEGDPTSSPDHEVISGFEPGPGRGRGSGGRKIFSTYNYLRFSVDRAAAQRAAQAAAFWSPNPGRSVLASHLRVKTVSAAIACDVIPLLGRMLLDDGSAALLGPRARRKRKNSLQRRYSKYPNMSEATEIADERVLEGLLHIAFLGHNSINPPVCCQGFLGGSPTS